MTLYFENKNTGILSTEFAFVDLKCFTLKRKSTLLIYKNTQLPEIGVSIRFDYKIKSIFTPKCTA